MKICGSEKMGKEENDLQVKKNSKLIKILNLFLCKEKYLIIKFDLISLLTHTFTYFAFHLVVMMVTLTVQCSGRRSIHKCMYGINKEKVGLNLIYFIRG